LALKCNTAVAFSKVESQVDERLTERVQLAARLIESQAARAQGGRSHKKIFDVYASGCMFGFACIER
jgi:hypothetical protein